MIKLFTVWLVCSRQGVASFSVNTSLPTLHSRRMRSVTALPVKVNGQDEKQQISTDDTKRTRSETSSADETFMFFASMEKKTESDQMSMHLASRSQNKSDGDNTVQDEEAKTNDALPYAKEMTDFISTPQIELIDAALVLLSSFIVALQTLPSSTFPTAIFDITFALEDVLSLYFCFGFFVRWYCVGNLDWKYLTKPLPITDFFASVLPLALPGLVVLFGVTNVPLWLQSNSALVNLRLLRILRLQELLVDMETFSKVERVLGIKKGDVRPYQLQLTRVLISIFTLCSVSTGLIYTAEHEVNPLIPDYFTALYFGLTTLTTVGFGDITPVTLQGRLVVMGSILVGVAFIPAQGAELVEALLDFQAERRQKKMIKNTLRSRMDSGVGAFEDDPMIDPRIACSSCGRRSHRSDAFYCWNCGAKLWVE